MKKLLFIVLAVLCLHVHADNYKILQMNTTSIQIGKSTCKQGDTFSDNDQIVWSADNQAIKAMNLKTKQIRLFVGRAFKKVKAKSVRQYFIKSNNLSTRGELDFSDLAKMLSDTLYVLDAIAIESPVTIDSLSSYLISYDNGYKVWRNLMSTDVLFYLNRELFDEDNNQSEYTLSLYYRRKGEEDLLVTDKLRIVLLPLRVDE